MNNVEMFFLVILALASYLLMPSVFGIMFGAVAGLLGIAMITRATDNGD